VIERHASVVVQTFVRVLTPLAQLFALYVLAFGHYSPGGGFQAGIILGATYILLALALGRDILDRKVNQPVCVALGAAGVLLYALTGVAGMAGGGTFLDYSRLPLPVTPVRARYFGILFIETGVTLGVAATLIILFCRLGEQESNR
jgi:multicomponent Na+:H+ antiporter subunit B